MSESREERLRGLRDDLVALRDDMSGADINGFPNRLDVLIGQLESALAMPESVGLPDGWQSIDENEYTSKPTVRIGQNGLFIGWDQLPSCCEEPGQDVAVLIAKAGTPSPAPGWLMLG